MSAVLERERRSTAGKRMTSLVGKAQEDDDAFWGHETWAEDADSSGNESFHESDEDSEDRVDTFDSDFDESESDHEAEEEAAGAAEELRLQREERSQKRKHKFDIAQAGRDLMQKKKGKGRRKAMGDGMNAGLVLNFPPAGASVAGAPSGAAPVVPVAHVPVKKAPKPAVARRLSRSIAGKRALRAATMSKSQQAETRRKATAATATATSTSTKKKQKRFTQEELLLEAATVTEPENERWLLARKRVQQTADDLQKTSHEQTRGKVICKFRSRRGCLNTLNFPEMDHVPEILAKKHVAPKKPKVPTECVITGKKARYRDPKTMLGYHDIAAFKELRRRFNAGEPLDQRVKKPSAKADVPTLQAEQKTSETGSTAVREDSKKAVDDKKGGPYSLPTDKPDAKVAQTLGDKSQKAGAKPTSAPPGGVASSKVAKVPALSTDTATRKVSPRRRKPSAKLAAAVETELMSPTKAPISNVILHMNAPKLPLETTSSNPTGDEPKAKRQKLGTKSSTDQPAKKSRSKTTAKTAKAEDKKKPASTNVTHQANASATNMIHNALEKYNKMNDTK